MNVQVLGQESLDEIVETSLRQAALWDQVKDDLHKSALMPYQVVSNNVSVSLAPSLLSQISS